MKKLLLGSLALAGMMAAPAMAADMPVKAAPLPAFACYDWSGIYAGAHAGYLWGNADWTYVHTIPADGFLASPAGFTDATRLRQGFWGGHAGVQWQFGCSPAGNFVIGFEAASSFLSENKDASASGRFDVIHGFFPPLLAQSSMDWDATVGLRLGWAWDTWLFTVNGGWAGARVYTREVLSTNQTVEFARDTHNHRGWYIGGVIEKMVAKGGFVDAIVGLEYQYLRFDTERHCEVVTVAHCFPSGVLLFDSRDVHVDAHTVRARLTIKTQGFGFFFAAPPATP
jgi:outer membrane immunogenic protein